MEDMLLKTADCVWEAIKPIVELGALVIAAKVLWAGLKMLAGNIKDKIIKGL